MPGSLARHTHAHASTHAGVSSGISGGNSGGSGAQTIPQAGRAASGSVASSGHDGRGRLNTAATATTAVGSLTLASDLVRMAGGAGQPALNGHMGSFDYAYGDHNDDYGGDLGDGLAGTETTGEHLPLGHRDVGSFAGHLDFEDDDA